MKKYYYAIHLDGEAQKTHDEIISGTNAISFNVCNILDSIQMKITDTNLLPNTSYQIHSFLEDNLVKGDVNVSNTFTTKSYNQVDGRTLTPMDVCIYPHGMSRNSDNDFAVVDNNSNISPPKSCLGGTAGFTFDDGDGNLKLRVEEKGEISNVMQTNSTCRLLLDNPIITRNFTLLAWIKWDNYASTNKELISRGLSPGGNPALRCFLNGNGNRVIMSIGGSNIFIDADDTVENGKYYKLVVQYVDGQARCSLTGSVTTPFSNDTVSSQDIEIGMIWGEAEAPGDPLTQPWTGTASMGQFFCRFFALKSDVMSQQEVDDWFNYLEKDDYTITELPVSEFNIPISFNNNIPIDRHINFDIFKNSYGVSVRRKMFCIDNYTFNAFSGDYLETGGTPNYIQVTDESTKGLSDRYMFEKLQASSDPFDVDGNGIGNNLHSQVSIYPFGDRIIGSTNYPFYGQVFNYTSTNILNPSNITLLQNIRANRGADVHGKYVGLGHTIGYQILQRIDDKLVTISTSDSNYPNGGVVSIRSSNLNSTAEIIFITDFTDGDSDDDWHYPGLAWNPNNDELIGYFNYSDRSITSMNTFTKSLIWSSDDEGNNIYDLINGDLIKKVYDPITGDRTPITLAEFISACNFTTDGSNDKQAFIQNFHIQSDGFYFGIMDDPTTNANKQIIYGNKGADDISVKVIDVGGSKTFYPSNEKDGAYIFRDLDSDPTGNTYRVFLLANNGGFAQPCEVKTIDGGDTWTDEGFVAGVTPNRSYNRIWGTENQTDPRCKYVKIVSCREDLTNTRVGKLFVPDFYLKNP